MAEDQISPNPSPVTEKSDSLAASVDDLERFKASRRIRPGTRAEEMIDALPELHTLTPAQVGASLVHSVLINR
jgi:hypothetical protein